jgi:hypothetical protein
MTFMFDSWVFWVYWWNLNLGSEWVIFQNPFLPNGNPVIILIMMRFTPGKGGFVKKERGRERLRILNSFFAKFTIWRACD